MNVKRFVVASILVFIVFMIIDNLIHMFLLSGMYERVAGVWRADMTSLLWLIWLGMLIFSFFFVYVFIKGHENKGLIEGVRYGLVIGLFVGLFGAISDYVVYPIPFIIAFWWFVLGLVEFVIMGLVAAAVYKPLE